MATSLAAAGPSAITACCRASHSAYRTGVGTVRRRSRRCSRHVSTTPAAAAHRMPTRAPI